MHPPSTHSEFLHSRCIPCFHVQYCFPLSGVSARLQFRSARVLLEAAASQQLTGAMRGIHSLFVVAVSCVIFLSGPFIPCACRRFDSSRPFSWLLSLLLEPVMCFDRLQGALARKYIQAEGAHRAGITWVLCTGYSADINCKSMHHGATLARCSSADLRRDERINHTRPTCLVVALCPLPLGLTWPHHAPSPLGLTRPHHAPSLLGLTRPHL